jgi:hypothetical protein
MLKQGPIGLDGPKGEAVSITFPKKKLQATKKRDNVHLY